MSNSKKVPIEGIAKSTDIVYKIKALLGWLNECQYQNLDNVEELITFCIELELGWILCNIAYGPDTVVQTLFYDK